MGENPHYRGENPLNVLFLVCLRDFLAFYFMYWKKLRFCNEFFNQGTIIYNG